MDIEPDTSRNRGEDEAPHMTPAFPSEDARTILLNRVSWGAVSAGVVLALAAHMVLNLLGVGIGAATITQTDVTAGSQSLSLGAMIWWTISGILAAYLGGFAAGRLSGEPKESSAGWHGLISWGAGVLVMAALMTTAAGALVSENFRVLSEMMGTTPATPATSIPGVAEAVPGVTGIPGAAANSANAAMFGGLFGALALMLGALAAWFGGRAGKVEPTITVSRLRSSLH